MCIFPDAHETSNKLILEIFNSSASTLNDESLAPIVASNTREKELAAIILWSLGYKRISACQIAKQFRMGNRAGNILDELCKLKVVSEKHAKQSRMVLFKNIECIPNDVRQLLSMQGISTDEIQAVFAKRE